MNRYNQLWSKDVQNVIFAILLCGWLGGLDVKGKANEKGTLLSIEDVGAFIGGTSHSFPPLFLFPCH